MCVAGATEGSTTLINALNTMGRLLVQLKTWVLLFEKMPGVEKCMKICIMLFKKLKIYV